MIKASVNLQDLRRRIYLKAKAEKSWRFWGLYVHVCKMETLREAYSLAKQNDGAPGVDGVTFEAIETQGVDAFLKQIQDELRSSAIWSALHGIMVLARCDGEETSLDRGARPQTRGANYVGGD